MESLVVRPARPGDAADLARNWMDAGQRYAGLDADAFQVPDADGLVAWFAELLGRPRSEDAVWLVAEVDGKVVGTAPPAWSFRPRTPPGNCCATLGGCDCMSPRWGSGRRIGAAVWAPG